jgi:NhaP-type Na+/H+ or K+/H+ antiporter
MLASVVAAADLSEDVFVQVAAILAVSAVAGLAAVWLRLPLVIAYIAVGIAVGPSAAGVVEPGGELELLAQLGVALLLFVVGLKGARSPSSRSSPTGGSSRTSTAASPSAC